jgi:hypothetical protein
MLPWFRRFGFCAGEGFVFLAAEGMLRLGLWQVNPAEALRVKRARERRSFIVKAGGRSDERLEENGKGKRRFLFMSRCCVGLEQVEGVVTRVYHHPLSLVVKVVAVALLSISLTIIVQAPRSLRY